MGGQLAKEFQLCQLCRGHQAPGQSHAQGVEFPAEFFQPPAGGLGHPPGIAPARGNAFARPADGFGLARLVRQGDKAGDIETGQTGAH